MIGCIHHKAPEKYFFDRGAMLLQRRSSVRAWRWLCEHPRCVGLTLEEIEINLLFLVFHYTIPRFLNFIT